MQADLIAAEAMKLGALQRPGELAQLVKMLQRKPPRTVFEIGTHLGGTFKAWCMSAADDALLISVDMDGGPFGGGTFYKRDSIATYVEDDQRALLLDGDSHEPRILHEVTQALGGRKLDFLFIDGDHSYDGVRADFETFSPLVKKGGIIALHDTEPQPEDAAVEVHRYWPELEARYKTRRFRTDGDFAGCGIGVIRW